MIKNHADASTDNPLNSRHPLDTKPSGDTAALMAPMASQSDAEAAQMRECVRAAEDTVKASGTTYYVSNTGSDSNPGDSPSRAWASVEKVNRWNLRAGDAVMFHRGDIFRGTITARSGVSYGAYGTGDKPAIYGARENAVGADWLEEPGNIWSLDTGVFNDIGNIVFNHGEEVGFKKLEQALTANNDFYHDTETGRLYLYLDRGSPSSVFQDIELCEKKNLIMISDVSDVTVENLCLKYGGAHGIGGQNFVNVTVRGCELAWIGGSILYDTTRYGNAVECWENCDGFLVENCYIYQIYDTGITHQGRDKHVHMRDIVYRNNLIDYCTWGIEYYHSDLSALMSHVVFEGNIIRFIGYGWGNQRPDKDAASGIKSWGAPNRAEDFVVRGNILDTASYDVFEFLAGAGEDSLPKLSGNTYIQKRNGQAGRYGCVCLTFDEHIGQSMAKCGMEIAPTIRFN